MKIKEWHSIDKQYCNIGKHQFSVARLIKLAEKLPVFDAQIDCLNVFHNYKNLSLRDMIMHFNAVNNADLGCPIILDEDGDILDGRHRIMKAIMLGHKTIKAVRFDENPLPCQIIDGRNE